MRQFAKSAAITALCVLALTWRVSAEPTPPPPRTKPSAQAAKPASPDAKDSKQVNLINLPIPVNETVKGIKIPYFDLGGKLRMQFFAEEALRFDQDHVRMARLRIEIFEDEGDQNMVIDLPASQLDLQTQVISSTDPVTLERSDFKLEGASMEFDTRTRKGVLRGHVRMQIFNRKNL